MKTLALALLLALLALASCSTNTQTAGSASVTTNGSIAGKVVDSAGAPAVLAHVYLIRADLDPALAGDSSSWQVQQTDAQGKYEFPSVPVGDYRMVVRTADSTQAAVVSQLTIEAKQGMTVATLPLSAVGSIRIQLSDCPFASGDRFYLPGTDIAKAASAADVQQGFLTFYLVPVGTYAQAMLQPSGTMLQLPLLRNPLVVSGAVAVLHPDFESSLAKPIGFFNVMRPDSIALGGAGGDTVTVTDTTALSAALADGLPRVVLVRGIILGSGTILHPGSNKTLLGVGDSAVFDSIGVTIQHDSNIVIRNILFRRASGEAVIVQDSSAHVWLDHSTFERCSSECLAIKRGSDFVTVSWNHFLRQKSVALVGHSDNNGAMDSTHLSVTFDHNWFEATEGMNPRVRYGTVHVLSNYFDSLTSYGVASTMYAKVMLEGNVFRKVSLPTIIGHTSPIPGDLLQRGNLLESSGAIATNGTGFEPRSLYSYSVDSVATLRSALLLGVGAGKLKSLADR